MSDSALERASIQVRVIKSGRRNPQLQFALVGTSNEAILVSETFQSANPPRREQGETAALESLLQKVRDHGWQIVARPTDGPEWWAFRFARGNHENIQREKEWVGLTSTQTAAPPQSTVHSADFSDTAGVLAGAEPGVMYLTLDVTIRNVSDDEKSFNALYWSGKDIVNGYAFDDDLFAGGSVNQLPSGDLQLSDLIRGEVVLKVRDDSQKIRIKYDTSPIVGANLYWLFEAP